MRVIHLLIKLFLLMALAIGLSGCQKDPVQPMDASAHVAKVSEKKEANSSTKKKTEVTNAAESKTTKASTTKKVEKPKVTVPQKPVTNQTATSTKPKTKATSTPTTSTQKKQTVKQTPPTPVATVTITIVGYENKQLLPPTKVPYSKGETFLDATLYIMKKDGKQYSVSGSGASAYVQSLYNLGEFDHGAKSGWLASKNGVRLTQSAGITSIKAGDRIEWRYTTTGE